MADTDTRVAQGAWRGFRTAAWLGWQVESNWADPFLFLVYAIAKPLALTAILVAMYASVVHGDFASPTFTAIYLGNAFYLYVGGVMTGMAYAVIDDRERYRMLKTTYVAPVDIRVFLMGRGVARFLTGTISVVITLVVGVVFLHLRVDPFTIRWLLLGGAMAVGLVMLAMLGLLVAGCVLLLGQMSWGIGEAAAGSLYLLSGAVFPLSTLPAFLRPVGLALPVTAWLELIRRALARPSAAAFPAFAGLGDLPLFLVFVGQTAVLAMVAKFVFAWCDHAARERGLIDRTTNF